MSGGPLLTFTKTELGGLAAPLHLPLIKVAFSTGCKVLVWQRDDGEWYFETQQPPSALEWFFVDRTYSKGGYRSGFEAWRGACWHLYKRHSWRA